MPERSLPKIEGLTPAEQAELDRQAETLQTEQGDLTIAVHCWQCGQPVTLVLTGWPTRL